MGAAPGFAMYISGDIFTFELAGGAVPFFGEPFGPAKLLGAALVLVGLVIVRLPTLRRAAAKGSTA